MHYTLLHIPFDIRTFFSEQFSQTIAFKKHSSHAMSFVTTGKRGGERHFVDMILIDQAVGVLL
jgi:hypothetical protein